jgi:glutamate synthase domain-containing protein 3
VNILREHVTQTGSRRGLQVLQDIDNIIDKIWAVVPNSEKANVLLQKARLEIIQMNSFL